MATALNGLLGEPQGVRVDVLGIEIKDRTADRGMLCHSPLWPVPASLGAWHEILLPSCFSPLAPLPLTPLTALFLSHSLSLTHTHVCMCVCV